MKTNQILSALEEDLAAQKEEYNRRKGQRDQLKAEREEREERIAKLTTERDIFEQTRILLQQTSEYAREQARQQIESLVSKALQYIFGP
ncbi:MAG: ATP-binding protein, partial [Bacillota bacterium]